MFIQMAFRSLRQIFIEVNVKNAFKILQFEVDIPETPYTLRLREQKVRQNDKFQPDSHFDCPLDQLSKRSRISRYQWIQRHEDIGLIIIGYR
jgi:hypothetical protein